MALTETICECSTRPNEIDEIVSEFLHEFIYHENSEVRYISLLDLKSPNSFQINMRVKELIM